MKNPEIVTNAIIDSEGSKISSGIKIYPITIRRFSWLEKLESPFIDPEKKFDISGIIPSVYIMCLTNDQIKQYSSKDIEKVISDSFDWSEDLSMNDVPDMILAVTKQMQELNKASPDAVESKETKNGSKKN